MYRISSSNHLRRFAMWYIAELTCKVDAIYYATSTEVKGVFSDGNSTTTILSKSDVKLNYDYSSERLIYYDGSNLVSVKLDGSDAKTIAPVITILRFAVDHITRKVYYLTDLFKKIYSIDLDGGTATDLNLGLEGNVKDLDTYPANRYVQFNVLYTFKSSYSIKDATYNYISRLSLWYIQFCRKRYFNVTKSKEMQKVKRCYLLYRVS